MTILSNQSRVGNFSSSEIYNLTKKDKSGKGFGVPAMTYISEKNMARRLGRSITTETNARPTTWGKCLEPFAFQKLGFDYELVSDVTIQHPDIPYWCGSPDVVVISSATDYTGRVGDIKCPMTLKSFCQLVDCMDQPDPIQAIRAEHSSGEQYYWQLVSNAILTGSDYAELIIFVPYRSDLSEIRLTAMDDKAYKWIEYADDYELPWLIDGGHYQDLNVITFKVPESDKAYLTELVIEAGKLLDI